MKPNVGLGFILIIIGIVIAAKGEGCSTGIGIGLILGGFTCFADTSEKKLGKPGDQGVEADSLSAKIAAASAEVAALTAEAKALSAEIAAVSAEVEATASPEVAPVSTEILVPASVGLIPAKDHGKRLNNRNIEATAHSTTQLWLIGAFSAATAFFATGVAFHLIHHERGGTAAGPAMWVSLVLTIIFIHRYRKQKQGGK